MDFETYKAHAGELTKAQLEDLKTVRIEQEHLDAAFKAFMPYGLPDIEQWNLCARLLAMFPDKTNTLWHVTESYLILGRF